MVWQKKIHYLRRIRYEMTSKISQGNGLKDGVYPSQSAPSGTPSPILLNVWLDIAIP